MHFIEANALRQFYEALNGQSWATTWDMSADPVTWFGVTMDFTKKHVVALRLTRNNLSGVLPSHIGLLPKLTVLELDCNQICGELPAEMGKLKNLELLFVHQNQLIGELPHFLGGLTELRRLRLDHNGFSGLVDRKLWSGWSKMTFLDMSNNSIKGELQPEISNLACIETLDLSFNKFTQELPLEFFFLKTLRVVLLNNNNFDGRIPRDFKNLTNLTTFNMNDNDLDEPLLPQLDSTIPGVDIMLLRNNEFPERDYWRPHVPVWAHGNVIKVKGASMGVEHSHVDHGDALPNH